ncbi:hypothetical protein PR048_016015 [Dryococelus australis]|uniref:Uncharacterized protein n=1 Tax=Dryococelus australis TaxID=614101 RepID=A0ABQ9HIK1_9NEOP|nr:hypothetical protein PR048_016015 [Dryococelus australis]
MAIICLVSKGFFESVELKYLVSEQHSFMDCDRDFGVIEKKSKVSNPMVLKELEEPKNTQGISYQGYKNETMHRNNQKMFAFEELNLTKTNVLKNYVSLDSLPLVEELPWVNFTCGISKKKRKDLLAMLT